MSKCKNKLYFNEHYLICDNKHTYDISKKGITTLIANNHIKRSKVYNQTLFLNRRKFIEKLFYYELYDFISNIVNNKFKKKINILDFDCGEGAHTINILNLLDCKYNYYGFDYSKVAIEMASKYNYYSRFYFVGDVNDVSIKEAHDLYLKEHVSYI